ncbi:T9SS type A sorting domain-containing protein [Chitinophaga sancti]|uniref:T9SS type A sorting domain-containing protein n=1 Tax=Chitinophaga sancti TaxID=1004 RepID=A0A1K1MPS9_9BACT|nr:T9SS type A sorting domain-containing protein [Chitinophaga sancti]WQD62878.1 T9SS type A sorting domain-containing protein [Chitinophaga sancti]WQG91498.1 T9SS type A sorting domain-containing protein [Chitinophaga sancti]SFW25178.1 hypothetical protein SAMN05661012_00775 [Chitinophaga sancti]
MKLLRILKLIVLLIQASVLSMRKLLLFTHLLIITFCLFVPLTIMGQTSWKGTVNTSWSESGNWTAGVPAANSSVVIGDANFTGSFQPTVNIPASCKSLTLTSGTLTQNKSLYIGGNLTINAGATLTHNSGPLTVSGNFIRNGTYTAASGATVLLSGTASTITGTTTFSNLNILAGSNVSISNNITVNNALTVNGTFTPVENTTPYLVSGTGALNVGANGTLKVNAATFGANYGLSGTITLAAGSTVEYSANTVAQSISATPSYSTLKISGSTVKTLPGNLSALNSSTAYTGKIDVTAGTLDVATFTANRGSSVTGGWLHVGNGATLRIGGTNTLPTGFASTQLELNSTIEYYGTTQTVAAATYGNLILSTTSSTKVTTATPTTINGDLTIAASVTFAPAANMTMNGATNINGTMNGGSFTYTLNGNWANTGTFTGNTSTVILNGNGTTITGTGTNNFNNLTIGTGNVTAAATSAINVAGNMVSNGTFTHGSGGTVTLSGATSTITGTGIIFDNLTISGTVTASSNFAMTGNLVVNGTYTGSSNILTMTGASKTISGTGTTTFSTLFIQGSITAANNFTIANALDVSGNLTTTNTTTFSGTSTLSGTPNLNNVTVSGTSLQLAANAVLGVAGALTLTGTLNVTGTIPNTVNFNGSSAQTIPTGTYNNLTIAGGNTKTAGGALTVNGDLNIASGGTFAAGSYTHTVSGNWINTGTFTPGTSTIALAGNTNTTISGAAAATVTFNNLTLSKTNQTNTVTMANSVTINGTPTLTTGIIYTGSNVMTFAGSERTTGAGIVIGTITRLFTSLLGVGTSYFESSLTYLTGITTVLNGSITVTTTKMPVTSFPSGASVNRTYAFTTSGISLSLFPTLSLHYEDIELNGNVENNMQIYSGTTGSGTWSVLGKNTNNSTSNFVNYNALSIAVNGNSATFSDGAPVVRWIGGTSTDWNTASNWTVVGGGTARVPTTTDVADLGSANFTNQPNISAAASVRAVYFGSASTNPVTLSITSGGSLTTSGNITASWSANKTHTINADAQNITVGGDLLLSDGTAGHAINLNVSTGTVSVAGNVWQTGGANITFSGAGALNISGDFNYSSGTFTPSTSTVTYNGTISQIVAAVPYNNLTIAKSAAIAGINSAITVAGNLSLTTAAGQLDLNANLTVTGNVTNAAILNAKNATITLSGNWSNTGTFTPGGSTVIFSGTGAQSISASTFNNLTVNKSSGNATLGGVAVINGNLTVTAGTLDLSTFTANRSIAGGSCTIAAGASLLAGSSFPANYNLYSFAATSTETYSGTTAQTVSPLTYGNLSFTGAGTKTLSGSTILSGNLNNGSSWTLNGATNLLSISGGFTNNGTFTPATGTVVLSGTGQTITGATTFNKLSITGSYTTSGINLIFNGQLAVPAGGTFTTGAGVITLNGDVSIAGSFSNTGTLAFGGTAVQNILFNNIITSNIISFNGSNSPAFYASALPSIATLNINNTAGVNPVTNLLVTSAFNTGASGIFNGGFFAQEIQGGFTNNGTFNSRGTVYFNPSAAQNLTITGTNFTNNDNVIFGGTAALNISGTPTTLTHVTFANTNAITPSSNWNIGGIFILTSNAVFNAGNNTFTIAGDLTSNGTLNGNTSVFVMNGNPANIAGNPLTTFYDYTVSGSVSALNDFNVSHNFTNNNAFNATQGTVIFSGSTPSIIQGTASPYNLAQFAISKSTGISTTLAVDVSAVTDLHIFSGILDASTFSITQNNGLLSIEDNAFLLIGGTNSMPAFNTYYLDTLSTVNYNGTTQAVSSATPYGNLVISTAGNKTASANLHMLNNFTLANGTFIPGAFIDTLEGDWTMSSGTFTNTGNTILFYGIKNQTVSATGGFNNITINKTTNNVTLVTNVAAAGITTFVKGLIVTSSNTYNIPAGGTISGANAVSGWIYGKLQMNFGTGTNVTRTYQIGDASNFTPATIVMTSVTTSGNLTGLTLTPDHPNISSSALDANRSVNRYWSFTNSGTIFTTTNVTVNWVAADLDAGALFTYFQVGNYNGSTWTLPTVTSPLATSITATGLTSIGDIAAGELLTNNVWTGAISSNWFSSGNWSAATVPTITTDATIPAALTNYPFINTSVAMTHNITIQAGASVTVSGGNMQISGLITNTGTFTASNGSIEMNGSTAQVIAAGTFATNTILNLTANNTAGLTIGGTLNITGVLKATTGTLATAGFVTLLSSATQTALIDGSGAGSVTGNVIMQRYLPSGFGYKYISSPFLSATVAQMATAINLTATFPTFYSYVENRSYSGWTTYTTVTNPLVPMVGYAANFGSGTAATIFSLTGVVNNGTITSPTFTNNNQPYTLGFNLAGNPYPSPVDWNASGGWTKTNIDDAIYYFNTGTTNQYTGTYSSYINGVSSDGVATNIIAAMQGFFVHVTNGSFPVTATFAVNNAARVNNLTPNYHRDAPSTVPLLRLSAGFTDEGFGEDAAVIYFDHSAMTHFDITLDALKLMNTDENVPNLFMRATDTNRLSIYSLPYLSDTAFVIPLGLYTKKTGILTFRTQDLLRMPAGWHIYLKDAKHGLKELLQDTRYKVQVNAGDDDTRFSLVFSPATVEVDSGDMDGFKAYSAYGKIYVSLPEDGQLAVTNMAGQVMFEQKMTGNGVKELNGAFSSGVYVVSFYSEKGMRTKKVFVAHQ